MFCPKCNAILPNDSKFCSICGAQLNSPAQSDNSRTDFGVNDNQMNGSADSSYRNQNTGVPYTENQTPYNNGGYTPNQNPYNNGGYTPNQNPYNNGGYNQNQYGNQYNNQYSNPYSQNQYGQYQNPNPNMYPQYNRNVNEDRRSVGFCILSFFIPVLGLVFYLVWKDQFPNKAKGCGIAAIIGAVCGVIGGVIRGILMAVFGFSDFYYDDFSDYLNLFVNFLASRL